MIYVTGDTHGLIDIGKLLYFEKQHKDLTYNDYVIIAGDFGGVFSRSTLKEDLEAYMRLPFTVLFVDGNHENFDLLSEYKVEMWNGGKVHKIANNIIHLMRGQVFEIEGKTIFTFGGATSIDKAYRKEGISWWMEEVPSFEELDEAFSNLERYNYKVDYIITHSCDEAALYYPPLSTCGSKLYAYKDNQMLSNFEDRVTYKHWYFGHYHLDGKLNDKKTVLYQEIIKLD